jgi:hypothetical protein
MVAGGASSTATDQVVCVATGAVDLTADAAGAFILGTAPWHDTDGDTGNGDPGTVNAGVSSATVTVSGTADCVWVCCPFADGTGCPQSDFCQ